jgi:hypothetical protein
VSHSPSVAQNAGRRALVGALQIEVWLWRSDESGYPNSQTQGGCESRALLGIAVPELSQVEQLPSDRRQLEAASQTDQFEVQLGIMDGQQKLGCGA